MRPVCCFAIKVQATADRINRERKPVGSGTELGAYLNSHRHKIMLVDKMARLGSCGQLALSAHSRLRVKVFCFSHTIGREHDSPHPSGST
jgi:hypothetical protein